MCLGATAGAYILTLFAVGVSSKDVFYIMLIYKKKLLSHALLLQAKYRERVLGLILVSPLCKAPTWTEWLYTKVTLL